MTIDTISEARTDELTEAWRRWRAERLAGVTAPFGTAALVATTWLTSEPTTIDGVPGAWRAEDGAAVGTGLARSGYRDHGGNVPDEVRLTHDRAITDGLRELRGFVRGGRSAVRLLDSTAPGRTSIAGIDAYDYDRTWRLPARYVPDSEPRRVVAVDGHVSLAPAGGRVVVTIDGREHHLVARPTAGGYAVVLGDTTNGSETYRFRFLTVTAEVDGALVADFNRAYLPPCAFSDQYVCPLPSPQNVLPVAVRAGERSITRTRT